MESDTESVIYSEYDDTIRGMKMAQILSSMDEYAKYKTAYIKKRKHDDVMRARIDAYLYRSHNFLQRVENKKNENLI